MENLNKTEQGKNKESGNNVDVVTLTSAEKDKKYSIDPSKKKVFDDFSERERGTANNLGINTLEYAQIAKISAERSVQLEAELFEGYSKKVEKLRDQIDVKKSSIVKRIFEFSKIKELEKELGYREKVTSSSENSLAKRKELVDAYEYLLSEEQQMASVIDEASRENKAFDERKGQEFLEDEKKRSLGDLVARHGVFFVHDIIDAEWKPSANNNVLDTKKTDFNDQLDIVLGLDPTISVSTLKEDTKQNTFGEGAWGVFLSGGRVIGGEQTDAGTVAYGLRDRRLTGSDTNKTIEGIDKAINGDSDFNTRERGYNELVVEQPEVAGVYVKWGTEGWPEIKEGEDVLLSKQIARGRDAFAPWWEKMSDVVKRNVPVFVLDRKNNHVRMLHDIDFKNKTFKVSSEFDPKNMTDLPGIYKQHLGDVEKKQSVMRVVDKVSGILSEEERDMYKSDGTEMDSRGLYSVH